MSCVLVSYLLAVMFVDGGVCLLDYVFVCVCVRVCLRERVISFRCLCDCGLRLFVCPFVRELFLCEHWLCMLDCCMLVWFKGGCTSLCHVLLC